MMKDKGSILKRLAIFLIVLVLVAGGAIFIKKKKEALKKVPPPEKSPLLVRAELPKEGSFPMTRKYLGTIVSKVSAEISPRISGRIFEIRVREGKRVKKGELLAVIDDREIRDKIDELRARLFAAGTEFQTQRAIFERDKRLFRAKAISKEQLDISRARKDAARAQVISLKKALDIQEIELTYARLFAPFDGIITKRYQDPGDLAVPGRPVLSMEAPQRGYYVSIKIPQTEIPFMKKGDKVLLSLEGRKGSKNPSIDQQRIEAIISRVHPAVTTGTLGEVEVDVSSRPFGLPTGATVTAEIVTGMAVGKRVPVRALLENVDSTFVFLVDREKTIHVKRVLPIYKNGQFAVLEKGAIPEGYLVVVAQESALLRLHEGERVRIYSKKEGM